MQRRDIFVIFVVLLVLVFRLKKSNHEQNTGLLSKEDALDISDPRVHEKWEIIEPEVPVCDMGDGVFVSRDVFWEGDLGTEGKLNKYNNRRNQEIKNIENELKMMEYEQHKVIQQIRQKYDYLAMLRNMTLLQYLQHNDSASYKKMCNVCHNDKFCRQ